MGLFSFDIGEKAEAISLFVGTVRSELQRALVYEKRDRKLSQQQLATLLGVNRSVINRQIMGYENLTIRRVAELAWALGWDISFSLKKRGAAAPLKMQHTETTTQRAASQALSSSPTSPPAVHSTCNDNAPRLVAA
jgi:plasmid maintenance system antidote protein VapI